MKKLAPLIFLLTSFFGYNQTKITLDELKLTLNYTHPTSSMKFNPRAGVGLGIYHKFRKEKTTNFVIGAEYNYTRYDNASVKSTSLLTNISKKDSLEVNYHSVTFPLLLKINATKLFYTKLGVLLDFNFLVKEQGLIYDLNGRSSYSSTGNYFTPTLGLDLGIGFNLSKMLFSSISYSYFINNHNIHQRVSSFNLSLGLKF